MDHTARGHRGHDASTVPAIDGPTPEEVRAALDALLDRPADDLPDVSDLKVLKAAEIEFPVTVGDRRVLTASITHGNPRHGEMRSDDHVSGYEVEFVEDCLAEDCFSDVLRWTYSATHNIAGRYKTYCPSCETVHDAEEWG